MTGALTLALLGLVVFYLYELAIGASDSPVRVIMSIALFLLFAAVGAAMTRGWLRGETWVVTLTLVIGLLLLPTTWSMVSAGQEIAATLVGAVAAAAVFVGWKGRYSQD